MGVYVDKAKNPFRGMKTCHLVADTLDELHAFADKIGLKREWCQYSVNLPHYDISQSKRREALRNGAKEISNIQLVDMMRAFRSHTPRCDV